jgi:hypothetical protein
MGDPERTSNVPNAPHKPVNTKSLHRLSGLLRRAEMMEQGRPLRSRNFCFRIPARRFAWALLLR